MGISALLMTVALASPFHIGFVEELKALADAKSDAVSIAARIQVGLENDELKSEKDFLAACQYAPVITGRLPEARFRYEMALTALCMGEKSSLPLLCTTWDNLFDSVSRPRRKEKPSFAGGRERFLPTARVIRDIWCGKVTKAPAINPRIKVLFDEDQDARQGDWSKFTSKDIEKMIKGDASRLKEARTIVSQGKVSAGKDFEMLAFIFQHAMTFEDYATAHELAICAVIRGEISATWIAGASYDRMMVSASYPQRFGTQFRSTGDKITFDTIDISMTNDRERKIVIRKTLDEAMKVFEKKKP